jgi:hypothetical protein
MDAARPPTQAPTVAAFEAVPAKVIHRSIVKQLRAQLKYDRKLKNGCNRRLTAEVDGISPAAFALAFPASTNHSKRS